MSTPVEQAARRVCVCVFLEVNGESADDRDAAHRAEYALMAALAGEADASFQERVWRIVVDGSKTKHAPCDLDVTVHEVMEAGLAMGSGYLWTRLTSKAFPREGDE